MQTEIINVDDLKLIKKYYGEKMMQLCRELFATILERPGLLFKLIEDNFEHNKFLYDDIVDNNLDEVFKNFIYNLIDVEKNEITTCKTPFELLKEVGYILYECKTEEDIQSFKKYYASNEKLCTFNGGRLDKHHVFFAVKENVDEIRREDFKNPTRQDEYGTSVISIQFSRGGVNTLSIKNRYNHRVNNPDATFSNNLENIIEGLTNSFEREYNLNINQNGNGSFEIPGYVKANDGKYYKYNYEIDNIYYCPNNIIINNFEVKKYEKEKYIIADYFVIDLVNKNIDLLTNWMAVKDGFLNGLQNNIDRIEVKNDKETQNRVITIIPKYGDDIIIELDKFNRIIGYINNNITDIGDSFLRYNKVLKSIQLSNLERIGSWFLDDNQGLTSIDFPKLRSVDNSFLISNHSINKVSLLNLERVGSLFLPVCTVTELYLPCLEEVGSRFLENNLSIVSLSLPKLREASEMFLVNNTSSLKNVYLPNLETVEGYFLMCNQSLKDISFPNLVSAGNHFLYNNKFVNYDNFPKLEMVGNCFVVNNPTTGKKELKLNYHANLYD